MTDSILSSVYMSVSTGILSTTLPTVSEDWQNAVLWMVIVGFIIAFILAFAVGANDVANSFGTTVGAGTLTLKQACILASLFETLGAILLGAKVGQTIRKGIIDVEIYNNNATLLIAGEISAMLASGLWQLIATFLKLPVSGTHSIVGATVGFSLVARGTQGVNWKKIGLIVGSWFLSPVLAGIMAAGFYFILRRLIFQKNDPVTPGLVALPIMYSVTVSINCFSVLYAGSPLLGFDKLALWGDALIAIGIGLLAAILVQFVVVRKMKKSFDKMEGSKEAPLPSSAQTNFGGKKVDKLPPLMEAASEPESPEKTPCPDAKSDEGNTNLESQRSRGRSFQWSVASPSTREEAKLLRQQTSKRSRSTGQVLSNPSVRIPPLLQLEKQVLKANLPVPSVREVKDDIRRNFSEPAMAGLTRTHDAAVYEVYINRPQKMVTIHRRNNSVSDTMRRNQIDNKGSERELENLLTSLSPDMKLDEPFDDSDDEGLVMSAKGEQVPTIYSGAIEEGFRRLSTSQQNIIAIKIADDDVDDKGGDSKRNLDVIEATEGRPEVRKMFSFLQILTACFGSFAHGGNDVSNAIGPLIAIWIIYSEGGVQQEASTPIWILAYGGVGICLGLWVWGRRVIETMGNDLTNLTPSRGFTIELMSAITVLMASNVGLPVSTTHCKVGAVVAVGWVRAKEAVDWKIFRNIVLAWFVTVPISGGLSAITFIAVKALSGLS